MKQLLSLLLSTSILATPATALAHPAKYHAHAEETTTGSGSSTDIKTRGEEIKTKRAEFLAAAKERQLTVGKEVCTKMADQRTRAVEAVKTRINASDLTTEQKNDLLADADAALANLATYKTECSSATTVEALRTVVNKIKDVKVFKWMLPRLHALRTIHITEAFVGRLTNHIATMQKHIDTAEEKGCDVTEAEEALADYQTAVQSAQTHLANAKTVVESVGESDDPGATKREEVKAEMRAMKEALKDARDAHKLVISELKACRASDTETETESTN